MSSEYPVPLQSYGDAEIEVSQTTASVVYQKLRQDILRGLLKPGERLRVNEVAQRYGCGAIPTREALSRLSAEALVLYMEQRGFAVAPISMDSLADLTHARVWTAQAAMREAVLKGDAQWEERVLLSYHRLSKVSRYESVDPPVANPAFDQPHREFHLQLFSGCGSHWMVDTCMRLFDHAERYRSLSRQVAVMPREDEHRQILDAVLQRRVDDAVSLISEHFRLTAKIVGDPGK
ncbi:GntR family transcriptional regulator [Paraburkholderia sediminicola]|uniref:GntR family transcriptional regulator n=1 Tax=Paraburkholderia sediminicola TaxID=458836 RepID=UPI000E772B63